MNTHVAGWAMNLIRKAVTAELDVIAEEIRLMAVHLAPISGQRKGRRRFAPWNSKVVKIGKIKYDLERSRAAARSVQSTLRREPDPRRPGFIRVAGAPAIDLEESARRRRARSLERTQGRILTPLEQRNQQLLVVVGRRRRMKTPPDLDRGLIGNVLTMAGGKGDGRYTGGRGPGRLRRSIQWDVDDEGNLLRRRVMATAPYARYVEFPTSRTAAQPFLLPAMKQARGKFRSRVRKALGG